MDLLKLTTYTGERDHADGIFLADALVGLYARRGIRASILLRGAEGFGAHHHRHTDRLLTLSEDLPVVTVAIDAPERIEAVRPEVERLLGRGLLTLERARAAAPDAELPDPCKLTVHAGRGGGAAQEVVGLLHRHGVAGATALLGVDGTAGGERRRAAFLSRNRDVPVMVVSVGDGARLRAALPELLALPGAPPVTVERVRVCKRDGQRLEDPHDEPAAWQRLIVYSGEDDGIAEALVRRLRAEGAAGATSLRGFWGFHGDHAPHGDRFWSLRRRAPIVTVVIDRPDRARRWFAVADELTARAGLVTSEVVPEARAAA